MKLRRHLAAVERELEKADKLLTPTHPLRDAVAPCVHSALVYVGMAIGRAETGSATAANSETAKRGQSVHKRHD